MNLMLKYVVIFLFELHRSRCSYHVFFSTGEQRKEQEPRFTPKWTISDQPVNIYL